jgi:hypothetical protein
VEILRAHKDEEHFYWGTTYRPGESPWDPEDWRNRSEFWGSGYVLGMDIVKWIATSRVPLENSWGLAEDRELFHWLFEGGLDDNYNLNRTAFSEYPYPELVDPPYELWNEVRPYDRWVVVTHPLKLDWMWVETAQYYLSLQW